MVDTREVAVISTALVIRLAVPYLFPDLYKILDTSVLFAAPVNSFRSLKEGIFLLQNGLNPYSGTIIHHPPVLIALFALVENELSISAIYTALDLATAYNLSRINDWFKAQDSKKYFPNWIVYAWCLFNPLGISSVMARSTTLFTNFAIVLMFKSLCWEEFGTAIAALALAAYLSYYPWCLIVPLTCYIAKCKPGVSRVTIVTKTLGVFAGVIAGLFMASYWLTDTLDFVNNYKTIIMFQKIAPNLGLWWYFFTEIFQFFNNFFIGVFNLYNFIFIIPFTLRFSSSKRDLLFAMWLSIGFTTFAKAYPTIADLSLFHSLVLEWAPLFVNLRVNLVVSYIINYVLLALLPVFYYVWMELNSGNSNFFYAIGLVFAAYEAIFLSDFIWSKLCEEYGGSRRTLTQI